MGDKNREKRLCYMTLASVVKEMAKPRLAASVRKSIGRLKTVNSRFPRGELLHNRNTNEAGALALP